MPKGPKDMRNLLMGIQDARSTRGVMSRGKPTYGAGGGSSPNPQGNNGKYVPPNGFLPTAAGVPGGSGAPEKTTGSDMMERATGSSTMSENRTPPRGNSKTVTPMGKMQETAKALLQARKMK